MKDERPFSYWKLETFSVFISFMHFTGNRAAERQSGKEEVWKGDREGSQIAKSGEQKQKEHK